MFFNSALVAKLQLRENMMRANIEDPVLHGVFYKSFVAMLSRYDDKEFYPTNLTIVEALE